MVWTRSVLTALGVAALATAGAVVVPATSASAADAATAVVRSAHFSPDTPGVDVYLQPYSGGSTKLWVTNEGYGGISPYQRIAPGVYVVSMRPHNAPASTKPAITWTLNAKPGAAYTAAAIGKKASLQAVILTDQLTPPAAGTGRVRIVQAASNAPSVTVQANGGIDLASKLPFGKTSDYKTVPTGAWDVRVTADSGSVSPVTSSLPVPVGSSSTVVVLDNGTGKLKLTSVQDSASSGVMPVGSVNAGGGATATVFAPDPASHSAALWGGVAGLAVLASVGVCVASRRRHARV